MPVSDAYSDATTYRSVIDKSDTGEDSEIVADLTAVSRWIDKELGCFFTKDAADVARDFRADRDGCTLYIDDLSVVPTTVLVDQDNDGTPEVSYATTDYLLMPVNAAKGPEPEPYTELLIDTRWSPRPEWEQGQLVRITGKWGWPAIPVAIARATIHLAALLRLETPRAQATISEFGQIVQSSPQARGIVDRLVEVYRHPRKLIPV